jgi:hypothetical protein
MAMPGVGEMFSAKLGPVPVWMIVVGGGIVLAVFAPKLLSKFTGSTGGSTSQNGNATPVDSNLDPNTGVPYAVETATDPNTGAPYYGTLFPPPPPPGGAGGVGPVNPPIPIPPVAIPPTGHPIISPPDRDTGGSKAPVSDRPPGTTGQNKPPARYIYPKPWPQRDSTLAQIAQDQGVPLTRLQALNPWIYQQRGTWNLIYTSDRIQVS